MEVKLKSAALDCYHKILSETVRKEETQDSVVPDTMPDIGRILCTSGNVLIRSKDIAEGRVRLEANIPARIVYEPEDGVGAYCLEVNLPFYVSLENEAVQTGSTCCADMKISVLETRLLNPRKISVRAEVVFCVDCYDSGKLAFAGVPEESDGCVNVKECKAAVTTVCGVGEKTFVLTDEYMLPEGNPAVTSILDHSTQIQTDEMKTVGTKIILKGTVKSWILYLTGDMAPAACEFTTGFSQIVDIGTMPESPYLCVSLLPSGAYYEGAGEGRMLNMELHLVMQAVVSGKDEISYLSDAYSNSFALSTEMQECDVSAITRELTLRETFREQMNTPEPVAEVLLCSYRFGTAGMDADKVLLPVFVCLHYKSAAGKLCCVKQKFHVKFASELASGETLDVQSVSAQELYITPTSGGVELRLPIELSALVRRCDTVRCIRAITYDENAMLDLSDQPTVVLMRVSGGDDLWKIAKENHSTVQAITDANGLDALGSDWERMLLIPKMI